MVQKKHSMIGYFFLKCSGASTELISFCPEFERIKYSSIGATIFFTALLAFVSSFYGLSQIFESYLLVFILALFWGIIIFNLDRYIVQSLRSGDSKRQSLIISMPRIVLAILVAVIISKPLEVKLFEDEINSYLFEQNLIKKSSIEKQYNEQINEIVLQKESNRELINNKLDLREKYYADYMCECNGTCGTGVKGRGIECEERKVKYETYAIEFASEKEKADLEYERLINREEEILAQITNTIQNLEATTGQGFFDKIKALGEVGNMASYFIMLIFIMVETAPLFTKLFSKKGPYDNLILQTEYEFETNFLKVKDFNLKQREKNQKLNNLSASLELKSQEIEIKHTLREKALARYDQIRQESFSEVKSRQ